MHGSRRKLKPPRRLCRPCLMACPFTRPNSLHAPRNHQLSQPPPATTCSHDSLPTLPRSYPPLCLLLCLAAFVPHLLLHASPLPVNSASLCFSRFLVTFSLAL